LDDSGREGRDKSTCVLEKVPKNVKRKKEERRKGKGKRE